MAFFTATFRNSADLDHRAPANCDMLFFTGKFDYEYMVKETRVAGPLLFGFFCLMFNIILLNFFITVVLEGFSAVRSDEHKQSNEYEIVEFIMKRVKMVLGLGGPSHKKTNALGGLVGDPNMSKHTYVESKLKSKTYNGPIVGLWLKYFIYHEGRHIVINRYLASVMRKWTFGHMQKV